jgi:glycosyltransferase involved in cell wall biosynthesis
MRIAWLGPANEDGGAGSLGALLLRGALEEGAAVDFFTAEGAQLPKALSAYPNLTVVRSPFWWRWNKWYSRHSITAFISGNFARIQMHGRIARSIIERHRAVPYDCVIQWSQCELFQLGRNLDVLPPVVTFPGVHAFGELRWHRQESKYAMQSEAILLHYLARNVLKFRAFMQRREMQKPAMVLGLSNRFNQLLIEDYGVPPERLHVLYHPIEGAGDDSVEFHDADITPSPMKLLFVGRISVRKGFEQIVELSRRLDDLCGEVAINVIGDKTQWSDYTGHIKELNPRIAKYLGRIKHREMSSIYDNAEILLVPSMYEPGGLVVGEALTRGVCVVASNEVGSAESISADCCRRFPAGNIDAFEAATRELIAEIRNDRVRLRQRAREQAKQHFSPQVASRRLITLLEEAVAKSPVSRGNSAINFSTT